MSKDKINEFQEILLYKDSNGNVKVDVFIMNEDIWMSQAQQASLFDVDRSVITKHLRNIFNEGELLKDSVCAKIAHTASDGKKYNTQFYNLDAVISVGYRVNSKKATLFRIWATKILKEYMIKGFAMDDERLKNPSPVFGKDYFDEQLARIRDIRSSERRFYQKITDIYAKCSADYDVNSDITKKFFATVQNKLHFAITQYTAAEVIYNRVDSDKENMGLMSWKNAPEGNIRKSDIRVAKNYLVEDELNNLNRIVTAYLDFAELRASRNEIMYMEDWIKRLDAFLELSEFEILKDKGKVSAVMAKELAEGEFEKYRIKQDKIYQSDFDRLLLESKTK